MALYIRKLHESELTELKKLLVNTENDFSRSRLEIIRLSAQGKPVSEISEKVNLHPITVRKWIHRFNRSGIEGLRGTKSNGRPPLFSDEQRIRIRKIAMSDPRALGLHFSRWSLPRLRRYLIVQEIVDAISVETVRQIVQSSDVYVQTWHGNGNGSVSCRPWSGNGFG